MGSDQITAPPAAPNLAAPKPVDDDDAPLTLKEWWIQNGPALTIVVALLAFLFMKFDSDGLMAIAKAALGLSFVIFFHELGHFLVAKWCDVHVTAFSIGFGPVIPGCWFKRGETTYKLALFPLGGYVQMVGQVDGDESSDGSEEDPRSFRNKSVGARMAIISAGVIMNVILAIICFVVVFMWPGKDRDASVISIVDPSAPAFRYGLRAGDEFIKIDDTENPYFETLLVHVLASGEGEELAFDVRRFNDAGKLETIHFKIEPRKNKGDKRPLIGVSPSYRPQLVAKRYVDRSVKHPAFPHSPATYAVPQFEFSDVIVATTDPKTGEITPLPDDPRFPGRGQGDYFELVRRMDLLAGKDMTIVVRRETDAGTSKEISIKVPPAFRQTLGVRMQMGSITAVRDDSGPGQTKPDIVVPDGTNKVGDLIQKVELPGAKDGKPVIRYEGESLDPERLPRQLRQWADDLAKDGVAGPYQVTLWVRRHRDLKGEQFELKKVDLTWNDARRFDHAIPMGLNSPLAIPELGIAYQIKTTVAGPAGDPGQTELQKDDVIKKFRVTYLDGKEDEKSVTATLEPEQWAFPATAYLAGPEGIKSVTLTVERNKETIEIEMTPILDETWPISDRGMVFMRDFRNQKASNIFEAVALGLKDTHNNMMQVFQNIRGMATGRISVDNLGGPITIAAVAYRFARMDFWEFVFFLGLISVNLAVINFLPIPILDGGHMVFLIYEKLRGKPASEGVRVGATYAGLAIILCLMVFVFYLDISRLFVG